jgi:uncharacterized lipoprotein YddW (UPF0748 family)
MLWLAWFSIHATSAEKPQPKTPSPEFRAVWVDAFHAGIRTPQEADKLVDDAASANLNTLIVQVRRRGDSLYKNSIEPPLREEPYDPDFDALGYIIEKAHARGLEVHAWVNAMPIWKDAAPPTDANHIYNLHGPGKMGTASWLTASPEGTVKFPVGYFLDAGHPEAADHVARVCSNIVRNYKVDGLHLDYIRYPETTEQLARGSAVGYNAVSLERFRRVMKISGATPLPAANDPQWTVWRRQQITQLMRRVYLEAKLANPKIKVSAAVIAWGKPPSSEKDFADVAPMQRVFQDWHGWLKEGILDISLPMNYAREHNPVVREWFNGWIAWQKKHKHGRQMVVGLGSYLNRPQATLAQIERTRAGKGKARVDGMSFFSYNSLANPVLNSAEEALSIRSLGGPPGDTSSAFATGVPVPVIRDLETPRRGWLLGRAMCDPGACDGDTIDIKRAGWFPFRRSKKSQADGNGYFGMTGLKPGRYTVTVGGSRPRKVEAQILVGRTTFLEIAN